MATQSIVPPLSTTLSPTSSDSSRSECYLPSPTVQSHASNLLLLPNGDCLCAWFGGTQEGIPDISIYYARLPSGSSTWTEAQKLSSDPTRSEQNPLLFLNPKSNVVWILYTAQEGGNQESAMVRRRISTDLGHTWGAVETLFSDAGTFIRQPIRILADGAFAISVFKCRTTPGYRWVGNDDISCVRISHDEGRTWEEVEVPQSRGCVHMTTGQLKDGSWLAFYRSRWADHIHSSTSPDGVHWSAPVPTALPNPNAGIAFEVLPSGRLVLVYNHSSAAGLLERRESLYDDIVTEDDTRQNQPGAQDGKQAIWGAPRAPLCLATSDDNGKTWAVKTLEEGDGYCMTNNSSEKKNRELSYPSLAVSDDGDGVIIHVAFTFWRQKIKFLRLDSRFLD